MLELLTYFILYLQMYHATGLTQEVVVDLPEATSKCIKFDSREEDRIDKCHLLQ
jgi:hypothetical protein